MRLPETFIDAKEMIVDNLDETRSVLLSSFGSIMLKQCSLQHYHISTDSENLDDSQYSNLDLLLQYKERVVNRFEKFEEIPRAQYLKVLTPKGDKIWPISMINKVWEGVYPSSVAVNTETGIVYFLVIRVSGLHLIEFGKLNRTQLEAFNEDVNNVYPYRIGIFENALFDYVSGEEGNKYLRENIYVEFDCGIKIRIKKHEMEDEVLQVDEEIQEDIIKEN